MKRCHDIIKFLCKYKQFPINLIDNLWEAIVDKHETTVRAGFDMLVEISSCLDEDGLYSEFY